MTSRAHVARAALLGTAAGLVAAAAMDGFQRLWVQIAKPPEAGEPATEKMADRIAVALIGRQVSDDRKPIAAAAVHYGFGAALGLLYGGGSTAAPEVRARFGTAFGVAVSLLADEIAVPAADLSPPPRQVPIATHIYGTASHVIFGLALESSLRLFDHLGRGRLPPNTHASHNTGSVAQRLSVSAI